VPETKELRWAPQRHPAELFGRQDLALRGCSHYTYTQQHASIVLSPSSPLASSLRREAIRSTRHARSVTLLEIPFPSSTHLQTVAMSQGHAASTIGQGRDIDARSIVTLVVFLVVSEYLSATATVPGRLGWASGRRAELRLQTHSCCSPCTSPSLSLCQGCTAVCSSPRQAQSRLSLSLAMARLSAPRQLKPQPVRRGTSPSTSRPLLSSGYCCCSQAPVSLAVLSGMGSSAPVAYGHTTS
jgi:hypothetical protein